MLEETQKTEAQHALDELFSEHLLPFKLSANRVAPIGGEEYLIYFHDSRLPSIDISWCQGECFKDVFRVAMLERVKRLSGPLYRKTAL